MTINTPVAACAAGEHYARLPAVRDDLVAFCCRTGNQQRSEMMNTPIDELQDFADALQRLLEREAQAFKDAQRG